MDRTQELKELRKELFRLRFEAAKYHNDPEKRKLYEDQAKIVHKKIGLLMYEIKNSEGQMGFAFTDTIDENVEIEEGRKRNDKF